jgi:hypothetical protein
MADPDPQLSPEKRLLQLIEGSGKNPGGQKPPGISAGTPGAKGMSFSKQSLKQTFAESKEKLKVRWGTFRTQFGLHEANKVARIILILLIAFSVINAAYEMQISQRDPLAGLDMPQRKMADINIDEPALGNSVLQNSDTRNIFLPFSKREEVKAEIQKNSPSAQLLELTKNLKLTGISYNPEDPKAAYCMIEDIQKNLTSFLHVGDKVGGAEVAKINAESVELEYNNEKIDIH